MIRSMTGYGRGQALLHGMDIVVEIKSVNHRYFECSCRLPRGCAFLEDKIKKEIQSSIGRGKIECFVSIQMVEGSTSTVAVDKTLAKQYVNALRELSEELNLRDDLSLSSIARFQDIFTVCREETDEDQLWEDTKSVLVDALSRFSCMRENEGQKLKEDILGRIETLEKFLSIVEKRSPETLKEYREKLTQKLMDLLGGTIPDENRILMEAGIVADRLAIAEETVRLRSHFHQMRDFLEANEAVGKKMDFLIQEFNRETNTIGSKCNDAVISKHVVEMKNEIEKIREQIQNIE